MAVTHVGMTPEFFVARIDRTAAGSEFPSSVKRLASVLLAFF
jgi:hypothetical protein